MGCGTPLTSKFIRVKVILMVLISIWVPVGHFASGRSLFGRSVGHFSVGHFHLPPV